MELGVPELLVIFFVVVLVFGPGRLAGLGGEIGQAIHEFRHGLDEEAPEKDRPGEENKKE